MPPFIIDLSDMSESMPGIRRPQHIQEHPRYRLMFSPEEPNVPCSTSSSSNSSSERRQSDLSELMSEMLSLQRRSLSLALPTDRLLHTGLEVLMPEMLSQQRRLLSLVRPTHQLPPSILYLRASGLMSEILSLQQRLLRLSWPTYQLPPSEVSELMSEMLSLQRRSLSLAGQFRSPPPSILCHKLEEVLEIIRLEQEKKKQTTRDKEEIKSRQLELKLQDLVNLLEKCIQKEDVPLVTRSSSFEFLPPNMPDVPPVARSNSFEFLPPNMSELRVVLLGNSWSERSSVGNFILGETKFNTEEEPDCCQRERGQSTDKEIVLINTPDLLDPNISRHELRGHAENCMSLSDPGPHVFLLVLQPEDFTEEHKLRLCRVLEKFSHRSFDHSLVLISTPREESPGFIEKYRQHPPLKEMIRKCQYRFLWRKDLELPELLTRLGQIVRENNGEHLSSYLSVVNAN